MASRFDFVPIRRSRSDAVPGQLLVAIEVRRALVGGDQQVHDAIAVEIAVGQAARHFRRGEAAARLRGDIAKPALAVVQEQMRRLRVADVAVNLADGFVDVAVDRDQVEVAVQIDIEERAAEAEAVARRLADSAACADIRVNAARGRAGTAPSSRYRNW